MKTLLNTSKESGTKKYTQFSYFKNAKRIRWSEFRNYGH